MVSRRHFLKTSMAAGVGLALYGGFGSRQAWAWYQSQQTPLWQTAFRGIGPNAIPVAAPDAFTGVGGATHYSLSINQFTDQVHPTLGPTKFWGYHPANPLFPGGQKHLGGIIVGQKGQPIQLTFTNNLPSTHIIPVDTSIDGANLGNNRLTVHLHGGPHVLVTPGSRMRPLIVG